MVVAKLFKFGDQVPEIPFVEVVGNGANVSPRQIDWTWLNIGESSGLTTIVIVAEVEHWLSIGVKVYVVVAVLFKAGDHVPVIPFVEVVGKAVSVPPEQIGATVVKFGVTIGFTVIVKVCVVAHWLVFGVKV